MYFTYVLLCENSKTGKKNFYIGWTENLEERLEDHRSKSTPTTKQFDKIALVYYEASLSKTDAISRERQLKTGFGRGYIKRRIESYLKDLRV